MKHFFKKTAQFMMAFVLTISAISSINLVNVNAMTKSQADEAMQSYLDVYYNQEDHYFYKFSDNPQNGGTKSRETDFWQSALLWDAINDAYERTGDSKYVIMLDDIYDGFLHNAHEDWDTPDWTTNWYNDDLCWWSQAAVRSYELTKNEKYLEISTEMFDKIYTGWDTTFLGGGIWWTRTAAANNQKNVATNANAAIIAARLSKAYAPIDSELSESYETIANKIYDWTAEKLYKGNGYIIDNILNNGGNGEERDWHNSYNFGLFAGASYELSTLNDNPKYMEDAKMSLDWVIKNMTSDGLTMLDEGAGDSAGFKLVYLRMMSLIANQGGQTQYVPFLEANAYQAWKHRRLSDGINGSDLSGTPDDSESIASSSAATGVSAIFFAGFDGNEEHELDFPGVYEAENARLLDVETGTDQSGFTGRGHTKWWDKDVAHQSDGSVNFNVNAPSDGIYKLTFRYYSRGGDNTRRISINDGELSKLTFTSYAPNTWSTVSQYAHLNKGDNSVKLVYFNGYNHGDDKDLDSWLFLDNLTVSLKEPYPSINQDVTINEITTVGDYLEGWSGINDKQYIDFVINTPVAGEYKLVFFYSNNSEDASRELLINGKSQNDLVNFVKVGNGWNNCEELEIINIHLNTGKNTIRLASNSDKGTKEYVNLMTKMSADLINNADPQDFHVVHDGISVGDNSVKIKTNFTNNQFFDQKCNIIIAFYDKQGKLVESRIQSVTVDAKAKLSVDSEIGFEMLGDEYTSKLMISNDNYTPLIELFNISSSPEISGLRDKI